MDLSALAPIMSSWINGKIGPDLMVANSTYVRERMRHICGRVGQVIFPPVEVHAVPFCERKDDYYVVASFLVPYKRIDLIIRAFNAMPNRRLRVVGEDGLSISLAPEIPGSASRCQIPLLRSHPAETNKSLGHRCRTNTPSIKYSKRTQHGA